MQTCLRFWARVLLSFLKRMKERCERLISPKLRLPSWLKIERERKGEKTSLLCKSPCYITMSILHIKYVGFGGMGMVCSYFFSQENSPSSTYSNLFHSYFPGLSLHEVLSEWISLSFPCLEFIFVMHTWWYIITHPPVLRFCFFYKCKI